MIVCRPLATGTQFRPHGTARRQLPVQAGTSWQWRVQICPNTGADNHGVGRTSCGGFLSFTGLGIVTWLRTNQEHRAAPQSGCPTSLDFNSALLRPNQVVGVPSLGNPLATVRFELAILPETLHSCLRLNYILRFICIHNMPESSLPPWNSVPQVSRAEWDQYRYHDWWPTFQQHRFKPVPKERVPDGRRPI